MHQAMLSRILILTAIFVGLALANEDGWLNNINNDLIEKRMQAEHRPASGDIALLEIDNKSLTEIGMWPWKRSTYAQIIEKAFAYGAEEIAFDIDFSASSSHKEDKAFETALENAPGPVTLAIFQQPITSDQDARIQVNRPIKALETNAWLATVNVLADADGVIRHFPYAQMIDDEPVSSLAGILGGLQNIRPGTFRVDFGIDPKTIPTFSVIDLLNGTLPTNSLSGKKILIGAGAAELRDTMAVPVSGMLSGPKLQILAAESILQNRHLSYIDKQWVYGLSLVIFVPVLAISLYRRINAYLKVATLLGIGATVELAGFWIYHQDPTILPSGLILAQLFAAGIAIAIFEMRFKDLIISLTRRRERTTGALLESIVKDSFSGILIVSDTGEIIKISNEAKTMIASLGFHPDIGQKVSGNLPGGFEELLSKAIISQASNNEDRSLKILEIHTKAETRYFEYSITPSMITSGRYENQEDQRVVTLLFHDVTQARLEQIRLEYLVDHDPATGLLNQKGFQTKIDESLLALPQSEALIFACQGRRLEKISQSLGGEYADILLEQIGARLSWLEEFDILACTSQKEFMLCKLKATQTEIEDLVNKIEHCLNTPFTIRGHNIIVGSLIGVADFYKGGVLAEEVSKAAIVALNRSRETNKRYHIYTSDLAADILHRRALEREIIDAVKNNDFELNYQPQVSLRDSSLIGCEALIRWNHRDLGNIRPDLFIPVMEETGAIVDIGRWILKQACQDAMTWPTPIPVAVNVSAIQFTRSDLFQDIKNALRDSGLPKERLQIEITESLFISDPTTVLEKLNTIRDFGIKIALDDFGTGYSSLSYIHQFPLDKLKIDRAFVKDLPHSQDSNAVINAVVTLARGFNLEIVAEGMETAEQVSCLQDTGCTIGQGWYFSKALPNEAFLQLCANGSPTIAANRKIRQAG